MPETQQENNPLELLRTALNEVEQALPKTESQIKSFQQQYEDTMSKATQRLVALRAQRAMLVELIGKATSQNQETQNG